VASPLRRVTKFNRHANVVRWFIVDDVASYAKALLRGRRAPPLPAPSVMAGGDEGEAKDRKPMMPLIELDDEEDGEEEELEDDDDDEVLLVAMMDKKREMEEE
jgi:hypothetical protein